VLSLKIVSDGIGALTPAAAHSIQMLLGLRDSAG
jgi:hypothetical protein